jgi:protein phosphatase
MRIAALSDIGIVRARNEDAFSIDSERGIVVVADGLGGAQAGEVAAALGARIVLEHLTDAVDQGLSDIALADEVYQALHLASEEIHQRAGEREDWNGMACSLIAAVLNLENCLIGHAGDTRAYLLVDGLLHPMTVDDTPVGALVKRGYLLPEKARAHHLKNFLVKSIGSKPTVEANIIHFPVKPGERLLFCSDGLWSMVQEPKMREILTEEPDPENACRKLVAAANEMGGQDNITVIVVDIDVVSGTRTAEMPVPDTEL